MSVKETFLHFFNAKKRALFFRRVDSEQNYSVRERKKHYEMVFEDGTITKLPKTLFTFQNRLSESNRAKLSIGKATYLQNLELAISLDQHVSIGSFCSFGPNVMIKPDGVRGKIQFTTYPLPLIDTEYKHKKNNLIEQAFVRIGNDCFIGESTKIMGNVTVSDGVIIGERSLVTAGKTLEAFGIYAGQPVKLIGFRYDSEIITELIRIQWWTWPLEKIVASGLQNIDFVEQRDFALKKLREL